MNVAHIGLPLHNHSYLKDNSILKEDDSLYYSHLLILMDNFYSLVY